MSRKAAREDRGHTLVELLVAMGLTLAIMGSLLSLATGLHLGYAAEAERADSQQRVRAGVMALSRDLARAGAGAFQGRIGGTLALPIASVFPFRRGATGADPPGTMRPDVVTIIHVLPESPAQTTTAEAFVAQSGTVAIALDSGCPPGDPACAFVAGMDVMIYDETGGYDTFRVVAAQAGSLQLQHTTSDAARTYAAGARIVEAASHTYFLRTDPATGAPQLMHYDGVASDASVADHVVDLAFEYFGDPSPPVLVKPVSDPIGPWTTYGPKPPALDVQLPLYPAGENCVFQVDAEAGQHVPRLAVLGGAATALVPLTAAQLTDGPWCPDAGSPGRYDADLLRIRHIGVTLRVEASLPSLRGPAGALFARAGTSRDARRFVPDQEVRFDISPRNLVAGR